MRPLLLVLLSAILLWSDSAFALFRCRIIHELYPNMTKEEEEVLDDFGPETIISVSRPRPSSDVIFVEDRSGIKYVVRFPSKNSSLPFERFASNFIRNTPTGRTPKVRVLNEAETMALVSRLRALPGGSEVRGAPEATVAVFYPMREGSEYLTDLAVSSPARDALLAGILKGGDTAAQRDARQREWVVNSRSTGRGPMKLLVTDLKSLGKFFEGLNEENAEQFIADLIGKKRTSPFCRPDQTDDGPSTGGSPSAACGSLDALYRAGHQ